jgi:O-antigen ligase
MNSGISDIQSNTISGFLTLPLKERIVYLILFAFPIGAVTVRHWATGTFMLLAILGLPTLFKKFQSLRREEKILFAILVAYFLSFVLSATWNGWGRLQNRDLSIELRFLLIIPIYLMVVRLPQAGRWLTLGTLPAALVMCLVALYQVEVAGRWQAEGAYSSNLLGPFAALVAVWLLCMWRRETDQKLLRNMMLVAFFAALVAMAEAGSRGGYLGFIVILMLWVAVSYSGKKLLLTLVALFVVGAAVVSTSEIVQTRVVSATKEIKKIVGKDTFETFQGRPGSVATRVLMWKASLNIFRDYPVLGIGRSNYESQIKVYVEGGLAHPETARHGHPHNAFFESLVSNGLVGLVVFSFLMFYPLAMYIKYFRLDKTVALMGMVHIVGFVVFSMSDASTILKGNYVSLLLIYLAVFYGAIMNRVRQREI